MVSQMVTRLVNGKPVVTKETFFENVVRVTFADGTFLVTEINGTKEQVRKYYIGEYFQRGDTEEHPADKMIQAVSVEFLSSEDTTED